MIDSNTRFTVMFRMVPGSETRTWHAATFDSLFDIFMEVSKWWYDERNKSIGNCDEDEKLRCEMAITHIFKSERGEYVGDVQNDEADEILKEAVERGENMGYSFAWDTPLVKQNAESHAVEVTLWR